MKLIVTGALGHIGSFLIRYLGVQFPNSEIVLIDNLATQRYASLFNLPNSGRYKFLEGDVTRLNLDEIFCGSHAVIHLAAITDAAGSFGRENEIEANNYRATAEVASACVRRNVRLIALSSTSVYGTQKKLVAEDCSSDELRPQSPYATIKLKEESLIAKHCNEDGLRAISCRFGTIFGTSPGMRFHTAVNKFCWQAAIGIPITVWTTAYEQKRPYLDLLDAARAITFILRHDLFDGNVYNILTHNLTVREIVETIREFTPKIEVSFVDNEIMNQLSYEVCTKRFKSHGFEYAGNLKRGIGETINCLRNANHLNITAI